MIQLHRIVGFQGSGFFTVVEKEIQFLPDIIEGFDCRIKYTLVWTSNVFTDTRHPATILGDLVAENPSVIKEVGVLKGGKKGNDLVKYIVVDNAADLARIERQMLLSPDVEKKAEGVFEMVLRKISERNVVRQKFILTLDPNIKSARKKTSIFNYFRRGRSEKAGA